MLLFMTRLLVSLGHGPVVVKGFMGKEYAATLHVVAAKRENRLEYWVAATERDDAVAAVEQLLEPLWSAALTERVLTLHQVRALKLPLNGVRKLAFMP